MTTGTLNIGPFDFSYQGNSVGTAPSLSVGSGIQVPCIIHDINFAFDLQTTPTPVSTVAYQFTGCTSLTFLNDKFSVLDSTTHLPTVWNFRQAGTASGVVITGTTLTLTSTTATLAAGMTFVGGGIAPGTQILCPGGGCTTTWTASVSQNVTAGTVQVWNGFGVALYINAGKSPYITVNKPTTVKYSAFLNCPTRCLWVGGDTDFEFNLFSGLNTFDSTVTNPSHGDGWFQAYNDASLGGTGLNQFKEINDTWLMLPNMNTGVGAVNGQNGATCAICTNTIANTGTPTVNVTNGSSSIVVDSNPGTIAVGQHPQIGTGTYNYGGFPPTFPGAGWPANYATCPATGCGATAQVGFSGSTVGTALTTDASVTLQTNEFVGTTGASFTGGSIPANSNTLTASSITGTPIIGDTISGTGIPAGTWLVSGGGTSWTLNQNVTTAIGPETITVSGPSPASPTIVAGGTGTSFTLSFNPGNVTDEAWLGQTGLGTWTLNKPWVSNLSGPIGAGTYPQASIQTIDFERNTIIGNFINNTSPSWLGTPQLTVSSSLNSAPCAVTEIIQHNYFDVCGVLSTTTSACTSPTSATANVRSYFPGPVSTTYADGSNIEMNNGACLYVQGTQPATCAPIPP